MSGTKAGALKARNTNYERHGEDFYRKIGRKGGTVSTPTAGFASTKKDQNGMTGRDRAAFYGALGGLRSRRRGKAERDSGGRAIRKADGKPYGSEK